MKKEMASSVFNKTENSIFAKSKLLLVLLLILIILISINSLQVNAGEKYTLSVTEEHPFLIDNEWIPASELQVGDLMTTADGKKARITKITDVILDSPVNVYNLEAGAYNDFVVDGGVVVHNSNAVINSLISKVDLNNLNQDELVRISEAEITLGIFTDTQKKTLIAAHRYLGEGSNTCDVNYIKGRILRSFFSEEQTRILMERGYAGKLVVKGNNGYWELNRNLAVANRGLERWVAEHSEGASTAIIDPSGAPWTRVQAENFIRRVIKKIDSDYTPHRGVYESPSFLELTPDGSVWEKKIVWEVESVGNRDPAYKCYVGGDNFHSRRFIRIRRIK